MIVYLDPVIGDLRQEPWESLLTAKWNGLTPATQVSINLRHVAQTCTREPETGRCYSCGKVV